MLCDEICLSALLISLAAIFHILTVYHSDNENMRRNLGYISGSFWLLSGITLLLFVEFN